MNSEEYLQEKHAEYWKNTYEKFLSEKYIYESSIGFINREDRRRELTIKRVTSDHTIPSIERAVFLLHEQWGFDEAEIKYFFGTSIPWVSERLKRVQERISPKNVSNLEKRERDIRADGEEAGEEVSTAEGLLSREDEGSQMSRDEEEMGREFSEIEESEMEGYSSWLS